MPSKGKPSLYKKKRLILKETPFLGIDFYGKEKRKGIRIDFYGNAIYFLFSREEKGNCFDFYGKEIDFFLKEVKGGIDFYGKEIDYS